MASAGIPAMSRPSKTMRPLDGGSSPAMAFSTVDLPAPLVPRRASISLRSTSMCTPNRTWSDP